MGDASSLDAETRCVWCRTVWGWRARRRQVDATRISLNSLAANGTEACQKVRLSMKLAFGDEDARQSPVLLRSSLSAAQRKKREYMSYSLVFCAVLAAYVVLP